MTETEKQQIESKLKALKDVMNGEDKEQIERAIDELTKSFYDVSTRLYQQGYTASGPQGGPNPGGGQSGPDGNVNTDYKVY